MRRILALLLLLPGPAFAGGISSSSSTSNAPTADAVGAAQNQQQNNSSSTSVGGNNYSNVYMTEFGKTSKFHISEKGVQCESPRFSIGIWGDPGSQYYQNGNRYQDQHDVRGGVSLSIPLGAERKTCQEMAKTFEKRVKFDTAKGIAGSCNALTKAGTEWTPDLLDALPDLKVCADIAGVYQGPDTSGVKPMNKETPKAH